MPLVLMGLAGLGTGVYLGSKTSNLVILAAIGGALYFTVNK